MQVFTGLAGIIERVVLVFWAGSLWTIGYVVAPSLFALLDDRALAGSIAGRLFETQAYISVLCGGLMLLGQATGGTAGIRTWLVIGIVFLIAVGEWLVGPQLAAMPRGSQAFAMWHGVSALLYLAASLCALVLVLMSGRQRVSSAA